MKEPLVSRVLKISLYIVFVLGIIGTMTLPFMEEVYIGYFYDQNYLKPEYSTFILVFMISVAILGLWIVLEMIWMLRSISNNPFIKRNVLALSRIGIILFVISAMFFAKCIAYLTLLTMGCGFIFLLCGFFAFTLANLIRQAVAYKEENDLTI